MQAIISLFQEEIQEHLYVKLSENYFRESNKFLGIHGKKAISCNEKCSWSSFKMFKMFEKYVVWYMKISKRDLILPMKNISQEEHFYKKLKSEIFVHKKHFIAKL